MEKFAAPGAGATFDPLELTNICFLGTSVESGAATAVVVATGDRDLPRRAGRQHRRAARS